MTRTIKFRGYNKKHNKWIYGFYFENRGEGYITSGELLDNPFHTPDDFVVIKESVGQFTGLLDKNGKEIYEGDIVNFGGVIHEIVFDRGCFYMKDSSEPETVPYILDIKYHQIAKVVGNIYENPELLQNEK